MMQKAMSLRPGFSPSPDLINRMLVCVCVSACEHVCTSVLCLKVDMVREMEVKQEANHDWWTSYQFSYFT